MKQLSKKQLLKLCIIFPILVSLLSRLLTPRMDEVFRQLNKPPFVPAPWIFSVVWLILDILLGLSLYTLLTSDITVWILALNLLNALMFYVFRKYSKKSALLLIPYIIWCLFAALLNLGFLIVN